MPSDREIFDRSGPRHLTDVLWNNEYHRMSVAASLVQGVYILERDRQEKREGPNALAPRWWEFFHFQLFCPLVDDADSSIFGAIYEFKPPSSQNNVTLSGAPHYVIAFRGTLNKLDSVLRDFQLNIDVIRQQLHGSSRAERAIEAVLDMVAIAGDLNFWLAGHSLGSAIAMLAGKTMAQFDMFIESFLFNPPYVSFPIERIKNPACKDGIRFIKNVTKAKLVNAMQAKKPEILSFDRFAALAAWVPCLFVNPSDNICSEYVGYFEHRRKMKEIGAGVNERLTTENSLGGLLMSAFGGKESEPLHLIPSASLTVNVGPSRDFKEAHGIHQWWKPDLRLELKLYKYM